MGATARWLRAITTGSARGRTSRDPSKVEPDADASLAIAAGADVKVLQRMLGHASAARTLDRYGHLMPGQAESVAERLDALARAAEPSPLAAVSSMAAGRRNASR